MLFARTFIQLVCARRFSITESALVHYNTPYNKTRNYNTALRNDTFDTPTCICAMRTVFVIEEIRRLQDLVLLQDIVSGGYMLDVFTNSHQHVDGSSGVCLHL